MLTGDHMKNLIKIADRGGIGEKLERLGFQYISKETANGGTMLVFEDTEKLRAVLGTEFSETSSFACRTLNV